MDKQHPAQLLFSDTHPLTAELDMRFESVVNDVLTVSLDAPKSFADQDGTHVHTGFTTLFMDTVMGACTIGTLNEFVPIATVKLNCNHLHRIRLGERVLCRARHQGQSNDIAYVSAEVFAGPEERLVSTAIGTFMIGTASKPLEVKS